MGLVTSALVSMKRHDVQRAAYNEEALEHLRARADCLGEAGGSAPMSWEEFQKTVPAEKSHTLRNMGIGALAGLALGAALNFGLALAMPAILVIIPFVGAAIGAYTDTQSMQREFHLKQYETYLDTVEMTAGKGRAPAMDNGVDVKTVHALEEQSRRQARGQAAHCK